MARGIDHIVHAVRDLDAAADLYRRLGFTVGARNKHSWGTENHLVQFSRSFIEILTVAEPGKLGSDGLSRLFGKFNRDFLARGQGLSLVILETTDAAADAAAFGNAGIAASDVLRFEREGKRPDGSAVRVAFSLAFARDEGAPDIGFAVCQQHYPENFWNPAFQTHANATSAVSGVVLVAENPTDHHIFLSSFAAERELQATSSGITIATGRGDIQVVTPAAFRSRYGVEPPDISTGARLAGLRFLVRDFPATVAALQNAGVEAQVRMGRIVVGPHVAMGATLVFEPS
jgi:catechol 2,3-dioxygenase-like lactoylglutathione lyase family enzyme